eukprot:TRINITY_DN7288_c0_g1_i12.p1 TRINITY_DN7288_c0_g1~~TRINITY_DN7288_c0_g1_i12.p1  ORF type:complete len:442 (+),score=61.53 TRINITY_DN7288_c0_g1_i12:139-1464(+)
MIYAFTNVFSRTILSFLANFTSFFDRNKVAKFILEFTTIVAPIIASQTIPDHAPLIIAIQVLTILHLDIFSKLIFGKALYYYGFGCPTKTGAVIVAKGDKVERHYRFLTDQRVLTHLATCLAILAVDFPIFPRNLCKAEERGVSLMDLGVGLTLFTSGYVARQVRNANQGLIKRIIRSMSGASPILIIGVVRLILVKAVNYQEHVSEYGVHWNFFITLSVVSFVAPFIRLSPNGYFIAGIGLALVYQAFLSLGLDNYILYAPRDNFFSANREGILGTVGYLAIYIIGMSVGAFLQSIPDAKLKEINIYKVFLRHIVWKLLVILALLLICINIPAIGEVSKRMMNASYVFWVCLHDLLLLIVWTTNEGADIPNRKLDLLEAVNFNQLIVFLVANNLTGAINLTFKTIYMSDIESLIIITGYMFLLSAFALILYYRRWRIKFW